MILRLLSLALMKQILKTNVKNIEEQSTRRGGENILELKCLKCYLVNPVP